MPSSRVEWHGGRAALAALAPRWDELASGDPTPYSASDWLLPWLDAFAGRRRAVLCTVWRGAELVAGLPLLRAGAGRLATPTNDHTPVFRPVFRDADALATLLAAVVDGAGGGALRVGALDADDTTATALLSAAQGRERRTLVEPQHVSPYVDLTVGEDAYRQAMRKRLADQERRRRRLHRDHTVRVLAVERPAGLERHLEQGFRLEAAGWKGRAGSAILSSPVTAAFYRDLARRQDRLGQLRVSALWVDGELAAFDLALVAGGRYHLLKTTYDEQRRHLGTGMILRLEVVERCFALRLDRHEFLGPDMAWKRVFANGARRHCAVNVFGPGAVGATTAAYRTVGRPLLRTAYRGLRTRLREHR